MDGLKTDKVKNLISITGDSRAVIREKPELMLEAVALAAEYGFDLSRELYTDMEGSRNLIFSCDKETVRKYLRRIIVSEYGGKGLKMLVGCRLMPGIIGEISRKMNGRRMERFRLLADNVNAISRDGDLRLGLFYTCFEGKKGERAMKYLDYPEDEEERFMDALYLTDELYFLNDTYSLKQFMTKYGKERYDYVNDVAKAQRKVFGHSGDRKLENRVYIERQIRENGEAVFAGELAINGETLAKAGIAQGKEAEHLLEMLVDVIHRDPDKNTEKDLLTEAARLSGSKIKARFRKVKWLK